MPSQTNFAGGLTISVGSSRVGNAVSVGVVNTSVGDGCGVEVSRPAVAGSKGSGDPRAGGSLTGASVAGASVAAGSVAAGTCVAAGACVGAGAPPHDVMSNATIKINMIRRIIQTHFRA